MSLSPWQLLGRMEQMRGSCTQQATETDRQTDRQTAFKVNYLELSKVQVTVKVTVTVFFCLAQARFGVRL
jgi:hypothetical protein